MMLEILTNLIIAVGAGTVVFQLYLLVVVIKERRAKKWTASKEKRLNDIVVSFRALASILIFLSCITLIWRMIRNI